MIPEFERESFYRQACTGEGNGVDSSKRSIMTKTASEIPFLETTQLEVSDPANNADDESTRVVY